MSPRLQALLVSSRRRRRGVTLVEILVVITIITAISAVLAFNVFGAFKKAKAQTCKLDVDKISQQATIWVNEASNTGCPTVSQLIQDKALPQQQNVNDPWGTPYAINCLADNVVVVAAGPDKRPGTADDIASDRPVPKELLK